MESKQKIEWLHNLHGMLYSLEIMIRNVRPENIKYEDSQKISEVQELIEKLIQDETDRQKMITG